MLISGEIGSLLSAWLCLSAVEVAVQVSYKRLTVTLVPHSTT